MAMTLRTEGPDDEALSRLATTLRCSKHQAALVAIRQADERLNHRALVDEAAGRMERDWKPVLDRLATT